MGEVTMSRSAEGSALLADARSGRTYVLALPSTTIGRELGIKDPYVSRRHARIHAEDGDFWLEDLASANGSYLNQRPVTARTRLSEGDVITLGHTSLRFQRQALLEARHV
jgi:pSer/pThr/pTyr-binding forkhead associated (FHA) protein